MPRECAVSSDVKTQREITASSFGFGTAAYGLECKKRTH